mmetsp:Transcript_41851/g.67296  ORF Transcript_41851/g.67296 Transcript_41851/m.67296 type:complete len:330 (-) Transcript_41851:1510-2499(-)
MYVAVCCSGSWRKPSVGVALAERDPQTHVCGRGWLCLHTAGARNTATACCTVSQCDAMNGVKSLQLAWLCSQAAGPCNTGILKCLQRARFGVGERGTHKLGEALGGACTGDEHLHVVAQRLVLGVEHERAFEIVAAREKVTEPAPCCAAADEQTQSQLGLICTRGVEEVQRPCAIISTALVVLFAQVTGSAIRQRLEAARICGDGRVVQGERTIQVALPEGFVGLLLEFGVGVRGDGSAQLFEVILERLVVGEHFVRGVQVGHRLLKHPEPRMRNPAAQQTARAFAQLLLPLLIVVALLLLALENIVGGRGVSDNIRPQPQPQSAHCTI